MHMVLSFPGLLASLLVALSIVQVDARPLSGKRSAGLTVPLKRITQTRSDVHPQVLLQQHINRGHRRLARMTGRAEPSVDELRSNLKKRMYLIPLPVPVVNEKRFDRDGVKPFLDKTGNALKALPSQVADVPGVLVDSNSTSNASAGFSEVAVKAAISGGLTEAEQPTTNNTVGLDIEANDVGYVTDIQIGTPPRPFVILVDSGSADFWVGAENCLSENGGGCGNHTFLGPLSSASFADQKQPFNVTYGSGAVSGDIITDDVLVAGLPLTGHKFGVATTESVEFSGDRTTFDGLMGTAQSKLSNQGVPTPVEALATAGDIPEAIISYKLGRISDGVNDGQVTFGALDDTKFVANTLTAVDNISPVGFWEAALDSITVNGQDIGLQNRTAILDTGTTLILAPPADAEALHSNIPGAKSDGQGGFTIPCTTTAKVGMTFGGRSFEIDPRDLNFVPVDANNLQGDCVSGITSGQIGGAEQWLVGDVFLKNVYFSTDVTSNKVTLASLS